jgi:hypothetical protein
MTSNRRDFELIYKYRMVRTGSLVRPAVSLKLERPVDILSSDRPRGCPSDPPMFWRSLKKKYLTIHN